MPVMAAVLALRTPRKGRGNHVVEGSLTSRTRRLSRSSRAPTKRPRRALRPLQPRRLRAGAAHRARPCTRRGCRPGRLLAVWRSAARFIAERAKASTWILTLVHRRAVDLVRREQPQRAEPLESAPQQAGEDTEDEAWLRLRRARVQEALKRLPDKQREALELAYYGGFTQSELADRLGEPLGTIKSRMFSGLAISASCSRRRHRERAMERTEIHELSAAYALDALGPEELDEFERHLAHEECREHVAAFQETVAELAYDTDAPAPSPALRNRVLADARREQPKVVAMRRVAAGRSRSQRRPRSPPAASRSASRSGPRISRSSSTTSAPPSTAPTRS